MRYLLLWLHLSVAWLFIVVPLTVPIGASIGQVALVWLIGMPVTLAVEMAHGLFDGVIEALTPSPTAKERQ